MSAAGHRHVGHAARQGTYVYRDLIRDNRLTFVALGLLVYLLDRPAGWDVRSETIAAERPEGKTAIRGALKILAELGYYRLERRRLRSGRFVMGTAVSADPVEEWIEDYHRFGGKPVPVMELPDGSLVVVDGKEPQVTKGAGRPESDPRPSESQKTEEPETENRTPDQPKTGSTAAGRTEAGQPGATRRREKKNQEEDVPEVLRTSGGADDEPEVSEPEQPPAAAPAEPPGPGVVDAQEGTVISPGDLLWGTGDSGGAVVMAFPGGRAEVSERRAAPTKAEKEAAKKRAFALAQGWWEYLKDQGTPPTANLRADGERESSPFMALRSLFTARLLAGYTEYELKIAMRRLYDRRHVQVPTKQAMDAELVAIRKGLADSAPVRSAQRRSTRDDRVAQVGDAAEEVRAMLAAQRSSAAGGGGAP